MWNDAFFNVHLNLHQIYLLRKRQVFIWWGAVWAYLEACEKALYFSSTARDSKRAGSANDYSQHRPCGCLQNKDRRLTTEDPKLKTQLSDISWSPYPFRVSRSSVLGLRSSLWDTPDQVEAREGGFLLNLLPSLNSQATSFRKLLQLSRLRICKMNKAIFCQESYPCLERLLEYLVTRTTRSSNHCGSWPLL